MQVSPPSARLQRSGRPPWPREHPRNLAKDRRSYTASWDTILTILTTCVAFVSAVGLLAVVCWSIAFPERRIWPPPAGKADAGFWLVWTPVGLFVVSSVIVGVSDFGSLGLDGWAWRLAGIALLLLGNGLTWWGAAVLGGRATTGLAGDLVTEGPNRFTRNPQYLGDILIIAGFVIAADSWLALWPSLVAAGSAIAAPLAEESWLSARFGCAYRAYERRVPRFLGPVARYPDKGR